MQIDKMEFIKGLVDSNNWQRAEVKVDPRCVEVKERLDSLRNRVRFSDDASKIGYLNVLLKSIKTCPIQSDQEQ